MSYVEIIPACTNHSSSKQPRKPSDEPRPAEPPVLHKAHLPVPWGLLVSTVVMLGPLEKTFTLPAEKKAFWSKPQLWIAECFKDWLLQGLIISILSNAFVPFTTAAARGTQSHSCMRKLRHTGDTSDCFKATAHHLVALLGRARVDHMEERGTRRLARFQGQSTAVGTSDCKTLMNFRRPTPTGHLAA
ncbi:uncharacterized protein V6R79_025032 [Siganus canaliculatus]